MNQKWGHAAISSLVHSQMHPARRGRTRQSPDLTLLANRPTQARVHARTTSSNICLPCTQLMRRHRVRNARNAAAARTLTLAHRSASPASAGPRTVSAAGVAPKRRYSGSFFPSGAAPRRATWHAGIPRGRPPALASARGAHAQVGSGREARRRRPASPATREVRHRPGGNASRRARAILGCGCSGAGSAARRARCSQCSVR